MINGVIMSKIKVVETVLVMVPNGIPEYIAASAVEPTEEELEKIIEKNIECVVTLPTVSKLYE